MNLTQCSISSFINALEGKRPVIEYPEKTYFVLLFYLPLSSFLFFRSLASSFFPITNLLLVRSVCGDRKRSKGRIETWKRNSRRENRTDVTELDHPISLDSVFTPLLFIFSLSLSLSLHFISHQPHHFPHLTLICCDKEPCHSTRGNRFPK